MESAEYASSQNIPLVLIPTHKSHIDYLVISWLCFHKNISLPFIAAGENLNLPIVGNLLAASGAFFIKRKLGTDPIYKAIFSEYITSILSHGFNLEFFIEGGRSRTGKLLNPKMGILSIIMKGIHENRIKDCYIVPISIGYDRVIETEGYIKELLGKAKPAESLTQLISAIELLRFNFGSIDVRIDKPYSLKAAIEKETESRKLDIHSPDIKIRAKARKQLVSIIAYHTMYRINMIAAILPTSLVVTALLTHEGRGMSKTALVKKVEWLRDIILDRGGKVVTFEGNTSKVIESVVSLLGSAIGKQIQTLETIYTPIKRFELSYYRNQLIHLFVSEAIITCCLYRFRVYDKRKLTSVPINELMASAQSLSRTLKHEFIYKVLPEFKETFDETLNTMINNKVVQVNDGNVSVHPEGTDTFKFLCSLLWPFIECYWLVSISFYGLYPNNLIEEGEFIKFIQKLGQTLYYQGELNFFESISKETTKLALSRFEERNVISKHTINEKGTCVYKLSGNYVENEEKLDRLVEKMGSFRRKGRYKLSGDTSYKRITKLYFSNPAYRSKL